MPSVFARPNKFDRSHTNLVTCDMGKLVPFYVDEVLPGDEFRVKTDAIIRLAPMLAPIFGQVDFYTHYFYVPNRLLWKNWEDFITNGQENGVSTAVWPYVKPTSENISKFGFGSLADFLDVPVGDAAGVEGASVSSPLGKEFSALPFRAYAKIWNDWYRNEFLQDPLPLSLEDGLDTTTNIDLQNRSWKRDYLTSALPFTQLGDAAVLPLFANDTATVKVMGNGKQLRLIHSLDDGNGNVPPGYSLTGGTTGSVDDRIPSWSNVSYGLNVGDGVEWAHLPTKVAMGVHVNPQFSGLTGTVDLTAQSSLTVNEVRLAFQLQRMMERKARSGNRYVEYLAASFGVRSPDARLQRAEFLGGGKSPVMISEVLQTSQGTAQSPQGNMSGHGFGASRTHAFNKSFTEHGYIIGILSVLPKASYFQGRPRSMFRRTYTDYYQPELAHIGEQGILNSEVIVNSQNAQGVSNEEEIFGFQPRYEEYRRKLSGVHGDYRSSLNYWHLARQFSTKNVPLNSEFVEANPSKRIFAAGEQADRPCWIEMYLDVKAIRPIPKHGNPGLIDH